MLPNLCLIAHHSSLRENFTPFEKEMKSFFTAFAENFYVFTHNMGKLLLYGEKGKKRYEAFIRNERWKPSLLFDVITKSRMEWFITKTCIFLPNNNSISYDKFLLLTRTEWKSSPDRQESLVRLMYLSTSLIDNNGESRWSIYCNYNLVANLFIRHNSCKLLLSSFSYTTRFILYVSFPQCACFWCSDKFSPHSQSSKHLSIFTSLQNISSLSSLVLQFSYNNCCYCCVAMRCECVLAWNMNGR
jgi:hypothetical protein